jgi:predicted enzyme related to lactoylglutathione lyase
MKEPVMISPDFMILFVADPIASAAFYEGITGFAPAETSPGFARFVFPNGLQLGLWRRDAAQPRPEGAPGDCEVAFTETDVDVVWRRWSGRGVRIDHPPVDVEFGRTFLARDPDGHRLRVLAPA